MGGSSWNGLSIEDVKKDKETLIKRLAKYNLKSVDKRIFSEFEAHLLTLGLNNSHLVTFKKNEELARKELNLSRALQLVHIDFEVMGKM